jgi:hypothetical protein
MKVMNKKIGMLSETGIWFKIIFWSALICCPLTVSMYAFFVHEGLIPFTTAMWFSVNSVAVLLCLWMIAGGIKLGWYILVAITAFSAIVTTLVTPSQWWVFLTSSAVMYLYYLALRHKGFWYKLY